MKILVTGSTGLVGTALVKALSQEGHTLCRLLRPQSVVAGGTKTGFDVPWNPATGELEGAAAGADATQLTCLRSLRGGRFMSTLQGRPRPIRFCTFVAVRR